MKVSWRMKNAHRMKPSKESIDILRVFKETMADSGYDKKTRKRNNF